MLIYDIARLVPTKGIKKHYITRILGENSEYFKNMPYAQLNDLYYNKTYILKYAVTDMYFYTWVVNNAGDYYEYNRPIHWYTYHNCILEGSLKVALIMLNSSPEHSMEAVLKIDNIERIKWVYKNIKKDPRDLSVWLDKEYYVDENFIDRNLTFIKWYCTTCNRTNYDNLILYAATRDINKFLWLYNNYNGIYIIDLIITTAYSGNNTPIIVWLTTHFPNKASEYIKN